LLDYNGAVKVTVFCAKGLRNADITGGSDVYCVAQVPNRYDATFTTAVMMDTQNPVWNHTHTFETYAAGDPIWFTLYDQDDMDADDMLGRIKVPWLEFFPAGMERKFMKLDNAGKGITAFIELEIQLVEADPRKAKKPKKKPTMMARTPVCLDTEPAHSRDSPPSVAPVTEPPVQNPEPVANPEPEVQNPEPEVVPEVNNSPVVSQTQESNMQSDFDSLPQHARQGNIRVIKRKPKAEARQDSAKQKPLEPQQQQTEEEIQKQPLTAVRGDGFSPQPRPKAGSFSKQPEAGVGLERPKPGSSIRRQRSASASPRGVRTAAVSPLQGFELDDHDDPVMGAMVPWTDEIVDDNVIDELDGAAPSGHKLRRQKKRGAPPRSNASNVTSFMEE